MAVLGCLVTAALVGGCATKPKADAGDKPLEEPKINATKDEPQALGGFIERHGDEIVVAGQLFRIGTPVVTWMDPGGYDAYRVERRFVPWERSNWAATLEDITAGKSDLDASNPARYNLRFNRTATARYTPEQLEQIRGGGWSLDLLREHVDQFVLHYDVCGTSQVCFRVLHDMRGLSVHFMLDIDGTIYQTLDLKERAWHATRSNDRSIGIEIANMGAYSINQTAAPLQEWYKQDEAGKTYIRIPDRLKGGGVRDTTSVLRPARNELIVGEINGTTYRQYDFTPQQYAALIRLTAALNEVFPKIKLDAPRDASGNVVPGVLDDAAWESFGGVLAHYHVQKEKQDPGPAFQWDYVLGEARKLRAMSQRQSDKPVASK